jgi:cell volume regulation protein A
MTDARLAVIAGALLLAAVASSLVAARLRLPSLLLFMTVGMVVGSDGAGWIAFDDYELARSVGTVGLAVILFDGGLSSGFDRIRDVLGPSLRLAGAGTLLTALLIGSAAAALFHLSLLDGLIVGSILSTTDSAAVFGVLRGTSLAPRLSRTLEGEAGSNDPVAVLLVVGFIDWRMHPGAGLVDMLWLFAHGLVIGAVVGLAAGLIGRELLQRLALPTPGLYPVTTAAIAAISFGGAEVQQGSGFLAVYLTGLVLAGETIPARRTIEGFHEGLAWVAQVSLFLLLGLLVFPSRLGEIALSGLLLALFAVLIARPLAVFVVTATERFSLAERVVLAWAGLRGATPVVFATYPVTSGVPGGTAFFDIVFFVVVVSTLLQGATFEPVAQALGLTTHEPPLPRPLAEYGTRRGLKVDILEYTVRPEDAVVGRRIRDLALPDAISVNTIVRGGTFVAPMGPTRLSAGDELHLVVGDEAFPLVPRLLGAWRDPSWQPPAAQDDPQRPVAAPQAPALVSGVWNGESGSPSEPELVDGVQVVRRLRARRDAPGALVALEDGRLALTGPSFAIGTQAELRHYAERRAATATDGAEALWWRQLADALTASPDFAAFS